MMEGLWVRVSFVSFDGATPCHPPIVAQLVKETERMFVLTKEVTYVQDYNELQGEHGYNVTVGGDDHPIFVTKDYVVRLDVLDQPKPGFRSMEDWDGIW